MTLAKRPASASNALENLADLVESCAPILREGEPDDKARQVMTRASASLASWCAEAVKQAPTIPEDIRAEKAEQCRHVARSLRAIANNHDGPSASLVVVASHAQRYLDEAVSEA